MNETPNFMVIVIDTLRADTLMNNLEKLPSFQYLLKESTLFQNAISPSSWTLPSHASIFSGLYPSEHGMHFRYDDDEYFRAISSFPTGTQPIQEKLKLQGYDTVAVGGNPLLSSGTAFERGFRHNEVVGPWAILEYYEKKIKAAAGNVQDLPWDDIYYSSRGQFLKRLLLFGKEIGPRRTAEIIGLLSRLRKTLGSLGFPVLKGSEQVINMFSSMKLKAPFFAFLNMMEIHEPYGILPNEFPFLERDSLKSIASGQSYFQERYDSILRKFRMQLVSELTILDGYLGSIIKHLKKIDAYNKTTIVVTSDHGQSLGEDGFVGHKYLLNDALVHVPLIIKDGKASQGTENKLVSLVDINEYLNSQALGESTQFPGREYVFAEAFGLNNSLWKSIMGELSTKFMPEIRKRIWSRDGFSLTLNGTSGRIEEFANGSKKLDAQSNSSIRDQMLREMEIFVGNGQFKGPSRS